MTESTNLYANNEAVLIIPRVSVERLSTLPRRERGEEKEREREGGRDGGRHHSPLAGGKRGKGDGDFEEVR